MKLRKIISLAVATAAVMTNVAALSISTVSAATVNTDTAYSEDFESFGDLDQQTTLQTLKNSGWYACDHTQLYSTVAATYPYSTMSYKLANITTVDGSKVLRIVTAGESAGELQSTFGYGRALPGVATNGAATGIYNIQFDYKPIMTTVGGKSYTQFYFGLNTANGSAANNTDAQHNILAGFNANFYLGYRDYATLYNGGTSISQGTLPAGSIGGVTWYTIKATVDCDNRYYSVEIYNRSTGKLIARRSPISFAGNESVGFLKFSALGLRNTYTASLYIDNILIQKTTTRNTLIYEDHFDYGSEVAASTTMSVGGGSEDLGGSSYFEGYTPWRALGSYGKAYGLEDDATLNSKVVRLGDNPSTNGTPEKSGLVYMPVNETILADYNVQEKRGKVKVRFKIKPDTISASGFQLYSAPDYDGSSATVFEIVYNGGTPAIDGVNLNASTWYDAEVVLDALNKSSTVTLKNHSTQEVVKEFEIYDNNLAAIKGIMFRAIDGTTVYMDDVKIEYFEANPTYDASKIVMTDKFGNVIVGTANITAAVKTIKIPFGCDLDGTTARPSTVLLKDSQNNTVEHTRTRKENSYIMDLGTSLLKPGETYTLTIPSTVTNVYGVALGGSDRTFVFTTTNSLSDRMKLNSVKIGGVDVSSLSDITAGSTINVTADYANSTESTMYGTALAVFYGSNKVIKVLTDSTAIAAGTYGTQNFSFNVPSGIDMSTVDKVSVLIWDGFANVTPFCRTIDFAN